MRPFRILSIDGGGIRGIIPGVVLAALEARLVAKTGDPDARLADHFDLVAGSSTGGILACGLLVPRVDDPTRARYRAAELRDIYLERGHEVFHASLAHRVTSVGGLADERYANDGLQRIARDTFGDLRLSQLLKPTAITAYDVAHMRAVIFAQHEARDPNKPDEDFLVRDVAYATCAAPVFFEAAPVGGVPMVDGGVFAASPALVALVEADKIANEVLHPTNVVLVSLGTGKQPGGWEYDKIKDWGDIGWLRPLLRVMFDAQSQTVDYTLRRMFDIAGAHDRYVRLDVALPERDLARMDDPSPSHVAALREVGERLVAEHAWALDALATSLAADARPA